MAYGQIDPARLDGDALTRWYLRSHAGGIAIHVWDSGDRRHSEPDFEAPSLHNYKASRARKGSVKF
jgi:hypothetical protein